VKGDIDVQIGQINEIVSVPGVDLVGPLPAEIQNISWMAAGIVATSKISEAADTFIKFISSPATAVLFKVRGYEPR
jgi:molybdate transport system substrate-binding protein